MATGFIFCLPLDYSRYLSGMFMFLCYYVKGSVVETNVVLVKCLFSTKLYMCKQKTISGIQSGNQSGFRYMYSGVCVFITKPVVIY